MNDEERLVGYLNGRDTPCPGCGYNLRGLRGTSCPECGEALTVERIRYDRPSALTPTLFVGLLGLVGGFVVLLLIWPVCMRWDILARGTLPGWDELRFFAVLGSTLGQVFLTAKWLDWADEMAKRPAGFRWRWAGACWLSIPLLVLLGWCVGRW